MTAPLNQSPDQQWLSDISTPITSTASTTGMRASLSGGANIFGGINNTFGIVGGLQRGGTIGTLSAGVNAAQLGARFGAFGNESQEIGGVAGAAGDVLGIYSGLKRGGVAGYGQAAVGTADLYSEFTGATNFAPYLAAPLAVYNFAQNYSSGKTGSDALAGAEAGAAIGSIVGPIGTVVGAVIGGVVGAVSSAFGSGATDPETSNWKSFINATGGANATPEQIAKATNNSNLPPAAAFNLLTGVMDIHDPGRVPIVAAFGRMGETNLLNQMTAQINAAYNQGQIAPGASPSQIYSQVVQPWLNSKGATIGPETGGLQLQSVLTSLIGSWQNGSLTNKTVLDSGGQSDISLPAYAGTVAARSPTAQKTAARVTNQLVTFPGSQSSTAMIAPALLAMAGGGITSLSGARMADPNNPSGSTDQGADAGGTTSTGAAGGSSFLSDLGSGVSSFLNSPAGTLAEFGTLGAIGLSQANAQKGTNDRLAGSLSATGQPFTAAGQAELSQLEGGPEVGGPLGQSIADQTAAASNLAQVAKTYSSGNLTPAQQTQVDQYRAEQRAQALQELSNRGITDPNSDQYKTAMQQIDDNAAVLGQQLITSDVQMAQGALTAVQSTYSNLLNQALSSSEFGFSTQEAGVLTQIQSDTQLAQSLNGLFAGIAQGVGTAMRPSGGGVAGSAGGGGAARAAGSVAGALAKGAGVAASAAGGAGGSDTNTGTDASGGYYDAGGNYITPQQAAAMSPGNTPGDLNTGYDNSTTDFSQSQGALGGDFTDPFSSGDYSPG